MRTRFLTVMLLLLGLVFAFSNCAIAEDIPDSYPPVIEGLDFGGATVWICDWFSTGYRVEEPTDKQQAQYDYWDWLERTYNVVLKEETLSDWASMVGTLQDIVENQDNNELRIVCVSGGFAGTPLRNGLFMPWTYGLENFNKATEDFMTINGACYGVSSGKYSEPRQCVFFNKDVLEAAGIDWNKIYDAQADGTWTWEKMEELMDAVQVDRDGDGQLDVYALTGNTDEGAIGLVASNEGDFFALDEDGKLYYSADSENTIEALIKFQEWRNNYYRPNENWDDYQRFWGEGNTAFFLGQSYEGFNGNGTVNSIENWGCVCLPKGPMADQYNFAAENNVYGVPSVYDEETSLKLQQIYTLYRKNPMVDEETEAWKDDFWALTDDRAIEETYAYMREHGTVMKYNLLGDRNSTVCPNLVWGLMNGTAEEVVESARGPMEEMAAVFNGEEIVHAPFTIARGSYKEYFTEESDNRYFILPMGEEALFSLDGQYRENGKELYIYVTGDSISVSGFKIGGVKTGVSTVTVWSTYEGEEVPNSRVTASILVVDAGKAIQIPDSAIWLEEEAFSGTDAECIVIPGSVRSIESGCFASCTNLKTVIWSGDPSGSQIMNAFPQGQSILFLSESGTMPQGLYATQTGVTAFKGF